MPTTPDPEPPDIELSPTGRVILGMIALGKRTGYDIKAFVDKTARYFWAASYGQLYPELKRLEDQGLVRGQQEPSGGRDRRGVGRCSPTSPLSSTPMAAACSSSRCSQRRSQAPSASAWPTT